MQRYIFCKGRKRFLFILPRFFFLACFFRLLIAQHMLLTTFPVKKLNLELRNAEKRVIITIIKKTFASLQKNNYLSIKIKI